MLVGAADATGCVRNDLPRRAAGVLGQRPVPGCVAPGQRRHGVRLAAQVLQAALVDRFQLGRPALCLTPTLGAVLAPQVTVKPLPKPLLQAGWVRPWRQACQRHGIATRMLSLQRTESALVHNRDAIKPMLYRLRGHRFLLALDNFGTGSSSLSYLRHWPFGKFKIDRSFYGQCRSTTGGNCCGTPVGSHRSGHGRGPVPGRRTRGWR